MSNERLTLEQLMQAERERREADQARAELIDRMHPRPTPWNLAARRDALPGLPEPVLEVLAREVTPDDCYRAAEEGGYDVATLVDLAARIAVREARPAYDAERERLDDVETRHGETLGWLRHLHSTGRKTVDVSAVIELLQLEDDSEARS